MTEELKNAEENGQHETTGSDELISAEILLTRPYNPIYVAKSVI